MKCCFQINIVLEKVDRYFFLFSYITYAGFEIGSQSHAKISLSLIVFVVQI